jgi:polyhydroxyalkanoate synthesis regulator phasin
LQFAEDGSITPQAVRQFVSAMPQAEQGGLVDTNGQPTKQAVDRINAAVFARAYGSDQLVRLYAQAQDPEARLLLSALAQVAPKMARLEGAGALDIRSLVTAAVEIAVNARRNGMSIQRAAQQLDMTADPDVEVLLNLFARNNRSNKEVVKALSRAADFAYREASKPAVDMFGDVPRATRSNVVQQLEVQDEQASQATLEDSAGGFFADQDAVGRAAGQERPGALGQTETRRSTQEGEVTDVPQAPQAQQAEAQQPETPAALARDSGTDLNVPQQPLLDSDSGKPFGGAQTAAAIRVEAQRDLAAGKDKKKRVPVLGTPDPKVEKAINELGSAIAQAFGIKPFTVAYSDPGGTNGFAYNGIAFINTALDQDSVSAPRTGLHEGFHIAEQMAAAGNENAQRFVAEMYKIYDDIIEQGKLNYIENFFYKTELDKLYNPDKGTGNPAAREKRIKEILQSPELRSEMVADFLGNRANDRGFFNDLAKADPKGFEAFVKKWLDIIDNLIAHLRGGPQQSRKESALVDKYIRDLNKGRMIARDALIAFRRGNLEAQGQADVQAEGQAQRQAGAQATAAPGAAASAKQAGVTPKSRRPKTQQSAVNQGPAFDGPETGDTPIGKATEIEVDGETRPALNSNGQPIYPTQEGVRNFWRWFGDSKVVDAQGRPVVVYHGTGNLENLQAFDPALTGKGNDQIGSGFYFTTDPEEAGGYTTAVTQNAGPDATKLGGDTSPGVAPVYLAISNPITVKGSNLVDTEIELTHKQALAIIKRTPNIRDLDESPIGNWIDVWGAGKITDKMISEVAQNYTGASLISLEGDFFRGNAAAFREALRDTIGRDGVTQDFGGKAHWVAWFPTQIKSATGNRGTFDPKEKRIDFSPRQRTPLGFYSALADGVQQMKASALPVVGWKDAIKGMLNKGQIKQDEVEWTGINDWLDLQQGKVTKEQVQEYLNANGVQVEEVVLGEDNSLVDAWWNDEGGANEETPFEDLTAAEQAEARTRFQDEVGQYEEGATKFSQYVLPGGENYREVLLTLPYEKRGIGNLKEGESLVAALDRAQQNNPVFRSSHWDQPNVIAHIRMNDRTDADGKRVLFVEELQSDWSAEGRKQGFADPTARDKAAEISAEMDSLAEDREQPSNRIRDEQRWLDLAKQRDEFLRKADGTPSAPFVTKTEGWLNLSLKRVIAMAADGGYDRVAFINGEQSADRYDLSKTVKSIRTKWSDSARDERKVDVFVGDNVIGMIVDADGKVIGSMTNGMNGKQLDEVIGKEMAKKVMETNGDGKWSGLDLKVGGEGMRGFYDKIVPAAVNKLLPKLGGGRMGAVNLSDQRFTVSKDSAGDTWGYVDDGGSGESGFATRAEAQAAADADNSLETGRAGEQPGFDITPAIRQKVEEGLPMFSRKQGETDADPDDIDILDSKKQRGVVELDKDGLILDNPRLSDVDRSLKINPKTVLRLFESATDKLRRSGSPKLKELATRVDRYFDQVEARAGKFNGRIRPAMKGIKEADLKVFEQYWRDFDNGRKAEAEKLLAANPKVLRLVRAVKDSFAAAGAENQSVGVKVFDSKTGEWRPIGKVGDFWPRVIRDEVARELESGGTTNPELWNEMLDALVEGGQVETKEEATRYIRNYFSSETSNDYFAGIERARGEKLPEMFYNYSWDVVPNYFHKWSQRVSQIENFGQVTSPGTEDFFDKVKAGVVDRATANYITAVQQRVYDVRQNTISNNLMANLNILATGLQLGNPATATLNYLGGTTLNVQMFGYGRVTKAQLDLARDFEAIMQEGTELGILGKDTMMILKDNDFRTEGYLSDEDRLAAGLRGFTSFTMKWGGYNGTEQIIRATAFVAARAQLNDALQAWQDKPKGITARKYNAFMERNRIDKDALIEENGAGEETAKYLRLMVNIPQGSYRIDQTPIYVDTPIGRFFFKYQKFATQVSRMYWEQNLKPLFNALTGKSEESVLTAVERNLRWFSAAFLGGTAILAARSALFGLQDPGPDEEELEKALRSDDNGFKMLLLFERAWSSMMAASALGMFGGIAQMTRDIADRQRVRFDPMNPPGFSAFLAVKELILRAHEQGKLTVRDIDDLATQTVALYRSNKRLAASAGNALDLDIREFQIEQARRDVAYVRKVAKWFARENKLEGRVTTAARYGLSPNTPVNRQIYEAVILNDFDLAMKLAEKEHDRIQELDGEKDEWKRRRQSILSSLRTRHPANIKEINNKEDREAFLEWVENKLPKSKQKMVIDMVNNYEDNISDLRKSMPK